MNRFLTMTAPTVANVTLLSTPWRRLHKILAVYVLAAAFGAFAFICVQNARSVLAPAQTAQPASPTTPPRGATPGSEPAPRYEQLLASQEKDIEIARLRAEISRQKTELTKLSDIMAALNISVFDAPKDNARNKDPKAAVAIDDPYGTLMSSSNSRASQPLSIKVGDLPTVYDVLRRSGVANDAAGLTILLPSEDMTTKTKAALDRK